MSKLKISAVSYLNTKPLLLGLELTGFLNDIELSLEVPSASAQKLLHEEVDIALIPVGALPKIPNAQLLTNYCIGANGRVDSVLILSNQPIQALNRIYFDPDSLTSNGLACILLNDYWQVDVELVRSGVRDHKTIGGEGVILIGDLALERKRDFEFCYDLASSWKTLTSLPFAFAVWVSGNDIDRHVEDSLNESFKAGLENIDKLIPVYQPRYERIIDVEDYFKNSIDYKLDIPKLKALDLYLKKLKSLQVV